MRNEQEITARKATLTVDMQYIFNEVKRIGDIVRHERTEAEFEYLLDDRNVDRCRRLQSEINALNWVLGE